MNITMFHDLDTGFLAATLKPAFEALGHTCTVIQTMTTYLDPESTHVDHLLNSMTNEQIRALTKIYKETDMFLIRSVSDLTLRLSGILPFLTRDNTIYRVHGSELRERNVPYSLRTWRINWHNKEPIVVGPKDPSLIPLYRQNTITDIERPRAFNTFPRRRRNTKQPFAVHTSTNLEKKGTNLLIDAWKSKIPLQVVHGVSLQESLRLKSQASYCIDNIGDYQHGSYHMTSVEAWFYKIPVFARYELLDEVLVPSLKDMIVSSSIDTVQQNIQQYVPDPKQLSHARSFALRTHDSLTIAQQYVSLAQALPSLF